jgi:hypothetical protein
VFTTGAPFRVDHLDHWIKIIHQNHVDLETKTLAIPNNNQATVAATTGIKAEDCPLQDNIQNHMVVTGTWIGMIMEFYVRVVAGVWEIYDQAMTTMMGDGGSHSSRNNKTFIHPQLADSTNLYVHVQGNKEEVLFGMRPLLQPFSSHPLCSLGHLLQSNTCQADNQEKENYKCIPRLILCGYEEMKNHHPEDVQELYQRYDHVVAAGGGVGRMRNLFQNPPVDWNSIRNTILQHVVQNPQDPLLREEIDKFKRETIRTQLEQALHHDANHPLYNSIEKKDDWIETEVSTNLHHYTLVGMSQRDKRRRWLNLKDTLQQCYQHYLARYKIVCVEINLSNPAQNENSNLTGIQHPYQDVVLHGGLDALIGIHGSQQTNAVYMPAGAYNVELLPHLYVSSDERAWGGWSQYTHSPTPNGIMTNETSLQHLGYPMTEVGSVPDCRPDSPWASFVADCHNGTNFETNDFVVDWHIIESFVQTFLVVGQEDPKQLQEFYQREQEQLQQIQEQQQLVVQQARQVYKPLFVGEEVDDEEEKRANTTATAAPTSSSEPPPPQQELRFLKYKPIAASQVRRSCRFFDQRSNDEFVLYTVQCWKDPDMNQRVYCQHYYRERDTFPQLQGCASCMRKFHS